MSLGWIKIKIILIVVIITMVFKNKIFVFWFFVNLVNTIGWYKQIGAPVAMRKLVGFVIRSKYLIDNYLMSPLLLGDVIFFRKVLILSYLIYL